MIKLAEKTVTVKGVVVRYKTAGEGESVVLIHGLSGSTKWWRRNIDTLAQKYQVFLLDLPGYGRMRRYGKDFVLREAASWLVEVTQAIGIRKADFIGHSMGGYICICVAVTYPEMVKRLILVSSVGVWTKRTLQTIFLPLLIGARYVTPSFFPILFLDAIQAGPIRLLFSSQEVFRVNAEELLKKISAPTLLIWGEFDTLVPVTDATVFKQKIAASKLVILKGAGHVPMFDKPKEFNAAVKAFLAGKDVGD